MERTILSHSRSRRRTSAWRHRLRHLLVGFDGLVVLGLGHLGRRGGETDVDVVFRLLLFRLEFEGRHVPLRSGNHVVDLGQQLSGGDLLSLPHEDFRQYARFLARNLGFFLGRVQLVTVVVSAAVNSAAFNRNGEETTTAR